MSTVCACVQHDSYMLHSNMNNRPPMYLPATNAFCSLLSQVKPPPRLPESNAKSHKRQYIPNHSQKGRQWFNTRPHLLMCVLRQHWPLHLMVKVSSTSFEWLVIPAQSNGLLEMKLTSQAHLWGWSQTWSLCVARLSPPTQLPGERKRKDLEDAKCCPLLIWSKEYKLRNPSWARETWWHA